MLREPPQSIQNVLVGEVLRDLEPSRLAVHARVGLAAVVGGFLSLMICGQFGIGMTSWADALNHKMHSHLNPLTCAVACGVMYSVFPIVLLRFVLTSPVLFRVILRRHQLALLIWYAGFGGVLTFLGEHGQGVLEYGAWMVGALIAANMMARLVDSLVSAWRPPTLIGTDA